jgi:hypothetical protein
MYLGHHLRLPICISPFLLCILTILKNVIYVLLQHCSLVFKSCSNRKGVLIFLELQRYTICVRKLISRLEPRTVHDMATSSRPKRAAAASSPWAYNTETQYPVQQDSPSQTLPAGKTPPHNSKQMRHVVRDRLLDTISK